MVQIQIVYVPYGLRCGQGTDPVRLDELWIYDQGLIVVGRSKTRDIVFDGLDCALEAFKTDRSAFDRWRSRSAETKLYPCASCRQLVTRMKADTAEEWIALAADHDHQCTYVKCNKPK